MKANVLPANPKRSWNAWRFWLIPCAVVVIALSMIQSGCNIIPPSNLKSPDLSFSDLKVADVGLDKIKLIVTLAARNPNEVDIPISNMKFDLMLMQTNVGSGTPSAKDVLLPKGQIVNVPVEFTLSTSQVLGMLKQLKVQDLNRLQYGLKGTAQWNNGPFNIPFQRNGEFSLMKSLGR
jgi:LEA14-like dessication related protein